MMPSSVGMRDTYKDRRKYDDTGARRFYIVGFVLQDAVLIALFRRLIVLSRAQNDYDQTSTNDRVVEGGGAKR